MSLFNSLPVLAIISIWKAITKEKQHLLQHLNFKRSAYCSGSGLLHFWKCDDGTVSREVQSGWSSPNFRWKDGRFSSGKGPKPILGPEKSCSFHPTCRPFVISFGQVVEDSLDVQCKLLSSIQVIRSCKRQVKEVSTKQWDG